MSTIIFNTSLSNSPNIIINTSIPSSNGIIYYHYDNTNLSATSPIKFTLLNPNIILNNFSIIYNIYIKGAVTSAGVKSTEYYVNGSSNIFSLTNNILNSGNNIGTSGLSINAFEQPNNFYSDDFANSKTGGLFGIYHDTGLVTFLFNTEYKLEFIFSVSTTYIIFKVTNLTTSTTTQYTINNGIFNSNGGSIVNYNNGPMPQNISISNNY